MSMTPRDWLLLFVSFDSEAKALDPVRIQKGLFLFSEEAQAPESQKYRFIAYNYGPMSKGVYRDLDELVDRGLLEEREVRGQSWSQYAPTSAGERAARELLETANPSTSRKLFAIREEVSSKSFESLLNDVYERYPDYASRSIFRQRT